MSSQDGLKAREGTRIRTVEEARVMPTTEPRGEPWSA